MTRQQETFAAMMNNWDEVIRLTKVAETSTGTASAKMNIYLESIEAKTNQLKTTWQEFILSLGQSESWGKVLDILQWILTHMPAAIGTIATAVALFKGKSILDFLIGDKGLFKLFLKLPKMINSVASAMIDAAINTTTFKEALVAAEGEEKAAAITTGLLNLAIGAIIATITIAVQAYSSWKRANAEAGDAARESAEKHKENATSIEEISKKYQEIYNSAKTYAEKQEELKALSQDLTEIYGK